MARCVQLPSSRPRLRLASLGLGHQTIHAPVTKQTGQTLQFEDQLALQAGDDQMLAPANPIQEFPRHPLRAHGLDVARDRFCFVGLDLVLFPELRRLGISGATVAGLRPPLQPHRRQRATPSRSRAPGRDLGGVARGLARALVAAASSSRRWPTPAPLRLCYGRRCGDALPDVAADSLEINQMSTAGSPAQARAS